MFGLFAAVLALGLLPQYEDRTWETVLGLSATALALALLIFCWIRGEFEVRTKLILTAVYVLLWPLTFVALLISWWALTAGQIIFASIALFVSFAARSR